MRHLKKIFRIVLSIILIMALGGILSRLGHSGLASLVLLGGVCYSFYKLSMPSESIKNHTKTESSINKKTNNKIIQHSEKKEQTRSDLFFSVTLNDVSENEKTDDYSFPNYRRCQATLVNESTNVCGFILDGPIYIGDMSNIEGVDDPSVIDPSLPIKSQNIVEALRYWPSYKSCTPEQRGRYLQWLTTGRGETDDLGYVFIYFYGMERYVFLDALIDGETGQKRKLKFIVKELYRLQKLFTDSSSFQKYSSKLLDAIFIKYFPFQLGARKTFFPENDLLAAKFMLAKHANEHVDQLLDSDWALHWLFLSGYIKRTKTAREQYHILRLIFKDLYEKADGIQVLRSNTKFALNYYPASPGMRGDTEISVPEQWYDPMVHNHSAETLSKISEELMPVVRRIAKATTSNSTLEILFVWPMNLNIDRPTKLVGLIDNVNNFCSKHPSPTVSALDSLFGIGSDDKITKSQLSRIAEALNACGWVMVPDPRITVTRLSKSDHVFLYEGTCPDKITPNGQALEIKIRLAAILAQADGEVHQREVIYINRIVSEHLNSMEQEYLLRYAQWRLASKTSIAGLKAQIDSLQTQDCECLARMLVEVAQADGRLHKDEIKELEKLFTKLSLDKSLVAQYLHESSQTTVKIAKNQKITSVSELPNASQVKNKIIDTALDVTLDMDILKAHAQSTNEVQSILSQIFDETAPRTITKDVAPSVNNPDVWHKGTLDNKHSTLLEWLVTREKWTRSEIVEQCQKLGLMIDGALESINDAAFEQLGDSLIEIDDPVVIYLDVLPS